MRVWVWETPGGRLEVSIADRFWLRLRGLLGRPALAAHQALWIRPCSSVHTFWMRYAIDVVFLNRQGCVLQVTPALAPWRMAACSGADSVLELQAGRAACLGLMPGITVSFPSKARPA